MPGEATGGGTLSAAAEFPGRQDDSTHRLARLAVLLAGVAGYVDAVGYVTLSGLFVSFMSGNTSSTGLALGQGHWDKAARAALPIPLFVLGVLAGALLLRASRRGVSLVLGTAAASLALFGVLGARWLGEDARLTPGWTWSILDALLVLPMGMQNAALRQVGGQSVGLTYVTGTLAALGENLAALLTRQGASGAAHNVRLLAGLWLGFALGATLGSLAVHRWFLWALAPPLLVLLAVAGQSARRPFVQPPS
jgi:uncharacterized membrane protein YoaK (UPF0700 family)